MSEKLRVMVVDVTPAKAGHWLEMNTGNYRREDNARVKRYAFDMKEGKWDLNAETIKFNGSELLDGQHRLRAIVMSEKTVKMVVAYGVDSAENIDIGRPRTVADWLRHEDFPNANNVAAAARNVVTYDKGLWKTTSQGASCSTNQEVIAFAENNKEALIDAVRVAGHGRPLVPQSMLSSVMFIGCGRSLASENDICTWFCNSVGSGESLTAVDPVFHLRKRLLASRSSVTKKMSQYMIKMLTTLAWNKTAKGEQTKALRLTLTGPTKTDPPNVIEVVE